MKSMFLALACTLLFALNASADSSPLTYEKIRFVADNCGSVTGFSEWLKTKKGIKAVSSSSAFLTSYPAKNDVYFEMNGRPYLVRVSPDLSFRTQEAAYERARDKGIKPQGSRSGYEASIQREIAILDRMLKAYEAQPQGRKLVK